MRLCSQFLILSALHMLLAKVGLQQRGMMQHWARSNSCSAKPSLHSPFTITSFARWARPVPRRSARKSSPTKCWPAGICMRICCCWPPSRTQTGLQPKNTGRRPLVSGTVRDFSIPQSASPGDTPPTSWRSPQLPPITCPRLAICLPGYLSNPWRCKPSPGLNYRLQRERRANRASGRKWFRSNPRQSCRVGRLRCLPEIDPPSPQRGPAATEQV
jgi:hypothetical protein